MLNLIMNSGLKDLRLFARRVRVAVYGKPFGPKCIPYSYMDPFGGFKSIRLQGLGSMPGVG